MKTLSDLKRDLVIGKALTLIEAPTMPTHRFLDITRYITKTQGNGVYLDIDKDAKSGSFIDFPKASNLEYDGQFISIFEEGERDLTIEEQTIINNRPSTRPENKSKLEQDLMTDTNLCWWLDKQYFSENNMSWYISSNGSKHYNHNTGRVTDNSCRGSLILKYKIS